MKIISAALVCLALQSSLYAFDCEQTHQFAEATRWQCEIDSKDFSIVHLKGNFRQAAQQHAYLLADEIIEGPMAEIILKLRHDLNAGSITERELKKSIFDCYYKQIRSSVSQEFFDSVKIFTNAVQSKLKNRNPFSLEELEMSAYAIELSIAAEGLSRRIEEDPIPSIAELASSCGIRMTTRMPSSILDILASLTKTKLGCIGFVSPESSSEDSSLMHARNLDANLVESWNREPVLFMMEETGYLKYVATASAGVIYPGGISGMNEAGISVSLHELSTSKYKTKHPNRSAELTPFLSQRILREARTLDQAISLVKRTKSFGAWTLLVSDSKTNEVASIEVSGERVQVARRTTNRPMGQSNHFLGSKMKDQSFAYSFGKALESNSRIEVIEQALAQDAGKIDLDWMIDHLAGHQDQLEGFRAFGRTAVKAYNVMSTIAIPARNEMWMSVGDRMPAAHSQFAGFEIDFENMKFYPLEARQTIAYENLPSWNNSLETYVRARLAYISGNLQKAYDLSLLALQQAQQDGIEETTYLYILGRLALEQDRPFVAYLHFKTLWKQLHQLAPHKQALLALYSAAAIRNMPSNSQKDKKVELDYYLRSSQHLLESLNRSTKHFDLTAKLKIVRKLKYNNSANLPQIDFVTIE